MAAAKECGDVQFVGLDGFGVGGVGYGEGRDAAIGWDFGLEDAVFGVDGS